MNQATFKDQKTNDNRSKDTHKASTEFEEQLIEECLKDGMSLDEIEKWLKEI